MNMKSSVAWPILVFAGILLCSSQEASAGSTWTSLTPASHGSVKYGQSPVIIEQGDTTVYEFTFRGGFGASDDCDIVPYASIKPDFAPEDVFFSLDPVELVTEKQWETQHVNAGEALNWWFTVYVSNPQLEPTLPDDPLTLAVDDYYRLRAAWSPYPYSPDGGIGIRGEARGIIRMQVTPEPATLALFGFGGVLLRKRKCKH